MAASTAAANPTSGSNNAQPAETIAELFQSMSYGPAPEADNVVKVQKAVISYFCINIKYARRQE